MPETRNAGEDSHRLEGDMPFFPRVEKRPAPPTDSSRPLRPGSILPTEYEFLYVGDNPGDLRPLADVIAASRDARERNS